MGIKVLHTADLHFGKKLHGYDLQDQQELFVAWLVELIEKEKLDYLVIAGDVFDVSNPGNESMSLYYKLLKECSEMGCSIIVTAGNHDSAGVIDAPKDLLKRFNIKVVGAAAESPEDCVFPIYDKNNKLAFSIAAVPFLKDGDIRKSLEAESYDDKVLATRVGIKAYYDRIADFCKKQYPALPVLCTGHLYAAGAEVSDSEREIQIGNLAGVDATTFSPAFTYVALGHIHKAQKVGTEERICYSGSPYPLSFSESKQNKSVRLLSIKEGVISHSTLPVPAWRELKRIEGSLTEVREILKHHKSESVLPDLAEVLIREQNFDTLTLQEKENLVSEINLRKDLQVILAKVEFENQPTFQPQENPQATLDELTPSEIFRNMIKDLSDEDQRDLFAAFAELSESALGGEE